MELVTAVIVIGASVRSRRDFRRECATTLTMIISPPTMIATMIIRVRSILLWLLPPCNDAVVLDVDVVDVVDGVLEDGNCFEVEEETRNTGYDTDKVVSVGSVVEAAELSRDVCDVIDVVLVTGDEMTYQLTTGMTIMMTRW